MKKIHTTSNYESQDGLEEDPSMVLEIVKDLQTVDSMIKTSEVDGHLPNFDENSLDNEEFKDKKIIIVSKTSGEEAGGGALKNIEFKQHLCEGSV